MQNPRFSVFLSFFCLLTLSGLSEPSKFDRSFSIVSDNDSIGNLDGDYSAGMELFWTGSSRTSIDEVNALPGVLKRLVALTPLGNGEVDLLGSRISIGQKIYTPRNLRSRELLSNDRPYAGWTYLDMSLFARNKDRIDGVVLSLGIVGPSSFADEVQENVHKVFGAVKVRGWENQLGNELALNLSYQRERRIWERSIERDYSMELVSLGRLSLGNVDTSLSYGLRWRGGRELVSDFDRGPSVAKGGKSRFRFSHLVELKGFLVGRNMFLDGNTFRDSHSVDKNLAVVETSMGVGYGNEKARVRMLIFFRSKEFDQQESYSRFVRIALEFGY